HVRSVAPGGRPAGAPGRWRRIARHITAPCPRRWACWHTTHERGTCMAIDKDLDFTGKTILVTGSGRNIGRAIILEFAAHGADVIINSRTKEAEARGVEHEARALGAKTLVVMGAAGEIKTVEEMQRRAAATFGRVDIYVSNAARRLHKTFFET